jgi:signal transduction histidine kinase
VNSILFSLWDRFKLNIIKVARFGFFKEARTSILLWYVILMVFFVATAVPTIRERLYDRVDERVRGYLNEEAEEFEALLVEELLESAVQEEKDATNSPSTQNEKIYEIFSQFINNRVTEDDNFLIAIVDGKFYKSSSRALPKVIQPGSDLMNYWQAITQEEQGEKTVPDKEVGSILYTALPIKTTDKTLGVFVVAHATAGERDEALEALDVIIEVKVIILAIALLIAWFAAGRILSPLKELARTAKSINESDLSQRIPVTGEGELAELGTTFNEMMDRLESSFATQRNFINDAGHELRTPITIIRGHLEVMEDISEEQKETVELVLDELDRMNRLVEDLILLAKAERPDFLQTETIDVSILTEELFTKARALGERNWCLDNVSRGKIVADRQRLTQAIMNLAHNAVQHTVTDNMIAISSNLSKDKVEFWVRDTGVGIASGDQKRIFERFARAANARRRSEGAGLGLSIVKAIAEAHGGYIHLQSHMGIGSTFIMVLPLEPHQKLVHDEANFDS